MVVVVLIVAVVVLVREVVSKKKTPHPLLTPLPLELPQIPTQNIQFN